MAPQSNALAERVIGLTERSGLTQAEVGRIVDASERSVSRWLRGEVVPQSLNKQRLIELAYVAESLAEVLPRESANLWLFTPNRLLRHQAPAELIKTGEYRDVLNLIDAIADGIVT